MTTPFIYLFIIFYLAAATALGGLPLVSLSLFSAVSSLESPGPSMYGSYRCQTVTDGTPWLWTGNTLLANIRMGETVIETTVGTYVLGFFFMFSKAYGISASSRSLRVDLTGGTSALLDLFVALLFLIKPFWYKQAVLWSYGWKPVNIT